MACSVGVSCAGLRWGMPTATVSILSSTVAKVRPAGSWGLKAAAAGTIGELHDEARGAHDEARQQRGDGTGAVKARPQNSENETRRDWRADISLDALQIDVELAADVVDEGHPK